MINNTTIVVDGTPVVVERGPAWFASLLFDPPALLVAALSALVVVLLAAVVYALVRVEVSPEVIRAVAGPVASLVACGLLTATLVHLADWPFVLTVLAGGLGGWAIVTVGLNFFPMPNTSDS